MEARVPEEAAAEFAAVRAAEAVRADVRASVGDAVRGAHDDALVGVGEAVERAVKSVLRDVQGGSW